MDRLSKMATSGQTNPVNAEKKGLKFDLFGIEKLDFMDIPHQKLVELAEEIGMPQHELSIELWHNDSYETKLLSCMFSEPSRISEDQADRLARALDSWIICDYCCSNLLWKLPFAKRKALEWADSGDATLSCVGFTLIAAIVANMPKGDGDGFGFLDSALFYARKAASNENKDVRRAVTSTLGTIGKRSRQWHAAAIETAEEIGAQPNEASRWVASQSLGDLKSTNTTKRFDEE
jgi:3-methyladenine DNA glycosylase AlkD